MFTLADFKRQMAGYKTYLNRTIPKVQEFTKEDWYGFAGCSYFPNGQQPLIAKGVVISGIEGELVGDPNGIGFYAVEEMVEEEDIEHHYYLILDCKYRWAVQLIMEQVIRTCHTFDDLLKAGF